jgi:hypothetical protein
MHLVAAGILHIVTFFARQNHGNFHAYGDYRKICRVSTKFIAVGDGLLGDDQYDALRGIRTQHQDFG